MQNLLEIKHNRRRKLFIISHKIINVKSYEIEQRFEIMQLIYFRRLATHYLKCQKHETICQKNASNLCNLLIMYSILIENNYKIIFVHFRDY